MSDPKRATLITVGAPKSAKNIVKKTVRLTINLDESNESKYPELNYKELVIAEERKKRVENGKTSGLDPFSDNDEDVQRVARKFEQKYGGKSTYGRKGRSKVDDFADIGAGYDESDSFIDNTHGYDEMIPPECDTFYGGFYINCGSLEFKNVSENQMSTSDGEPGATNRRNKRRISSSSSEEESSESSSDSESQDEKVPKAIVNGAVDSHETEHRKKEHRKKKNKKAEKKKAKKIRRTDSSAATSGKQTSDDNAQVDGESADSRTSQSDSLTSKPAPSSENAITSDSSRDVEPKVEAELPPQVLQVVETLEAAVSKHLVDNPNVSAKELFSETEQWIIRMDRTLSKCQAKPGARRRAWGRAAVALCTTRSKLLQQIRTRLDSLPNEPDTHPVTPATESPTPATATVAAVTSSTAPTTTTTSSNNTTTHKRKQDDDSEEDFSRLTEDERESKILETLQRLKSLIDDRKPDMIANYNAECERVQEERKKMQQQCAAEGGRAPLVEKRLPKRRFPWCGRTRALLSRLRRLAHPHPEAAARLLATRVLPLFPAGFVRMPTLLRQADLSKDIKVSEVKRQRLGSSSQPTTAFTEPIQFPSSLTVTTTTTTKTPTDKSEAAPIADDTKYKSNVLNSMLNSYSLSKDLIIDKPEKKDSDKKDEHYLPPNNIGSITITPVPNQMKADKKNNSNDKGFIRVKSPAALNEMVNKKDKHKKEKNHVKDKSIDTPLHIDTKDVSKKAEVTQKQIESMRVAENNIPRPALVPVQHSPTFAKPDKRPPEAKKKKDIVIVSDVDPLGDNIPEPLAIDDSSSDVEVVEEKSDKSEKQCETVPLKDKSVNKKVVNSKVKSVSKSTESKADAEESTKDDFDAILRNIREMESSQDPSMKMNSNSYSGVITNAKHEKSSAHGFARGALYRDTRTDTDKLAHFFEENGWM